MPPALPSQLREDSSHNATTFHKRAPLPDPGRQAPTPILYAHAAQFPTTNTHLRRALAPCINPGDACL